MNKELKILVTGYNGQLGYDCVNELIRRGYKHVLGIDKNELDITIQKDVINFILNYRPNVVIHCASWTAVDKAEQYPDEVYKVNVLGSKYIAEACKDIDAVMIQISTDYVFDGSGDIPFDIDNKKDALSVYGKTKSQCEDEVMKILDKFFIVRIS